MRNSTIIIIVIVIILLNAFIGEVINYVTGSRIWGIFFCLPVGALTGVLAAKQENKKNSKLTN